MAHKVQLSPAEELDEENYDKTVLVDRGGTPNTPPPPRMCSNQYSHDIPNSIRNVEIVQIRKVSRIFLERDVACEWVKGLPYDPDGTGLRI